MASKLNINTNELFKEEDFIIKKEEAFNSETYNIKTSIKEMVEQTLVINDSNQELSSREKNRAKRKAKFIAQTSIIENEKKNSDGSDSEPAIKSRKLSPEGDISETVAETQVIDNIVNIDELDEWPFDIFAEHLMNNLFNQSWEKRHGAATGLRELIKLHGKGAGRYLDMPSEMMNEANQLWLEDLAVRIVCVLALDRFGDFVSDEVVAPVRESCAQALGVTIHHMSSENVFGVMNMLIQLLSMSEWEVRHGGLLGIKYLLAVKKDLTSMLLNKNVTRILQELQDVSDDVRAVAAISLLPVTDILVTSMPDLVQPLINSLWLILADLDDLTSSSNSIMMLLSSLLSHPSVSPEQCYQANLVELVPRIWPFLKHNISSVRLSALSMLKTLLKKTSLQDTKESVYWIYPLLTDFLRHIFQRSLLENEESILDEASEVWCSLLNSLPVEHIIFSATPFLSSWMCLVMQPVNLPFDPSLLINYKYDIKIKNEIQSTDLNQYYLGGISNIIESTVEKDAIVVRARKCAAKFLGLLCKKISDIGGQIYEGHDCSNLEQLAKLLIFHLSSKSAIQRFSTTLIIYEWSLLLEKPNGIPGLLINKLHECLMENIYFDEIASLFTRLQIDCKSFISNLTAKGIALDSIYKTNSIHSIEHIGNLCNNVFESIRPSIKANHLNSLEEQKNKLLSSLNQATFEHQNISNRVHCSIVAVLVQYYNLPPSMNPIIRPLMDCLKYEENAQLQQCSSKIITLVIKICSQKVPCPNSKIIKNLSHQLSSDLPLLPETNDQQEIIDFSDEKYTSIILLTNRQQVSESYKPKRGAPFKKLIPTNDEPVELEETKKQSILQKRGATMALTCIAKDFASNVFHEVPDLWEIMFAELKNISFEDLSTSTVQKIVLSLQVLQVVGPYLHNDLHSQLIEYFPNLCLCLEHPFSLVRHMAGKCFASFSQLMLEKVMEQITKNVLVWLKSSNNILRRAGAIEAISLIIEQQGIGTVPYIVSLIVPILGCMTDSCQSIRLLATNAFAALVRLMPLGISCHMMDVNELNNKKSLDQTFLEQLLNPKLIEDYKVPVPIKVDLRRYQQEGINWLAFLCRYKLHGILCDDMGLGKTIQSLCILIGDHYWKEKQFKDNADSKEKLFPSLVISPTTLTSHWLYEVEKLVDKDVLKPLHYIGHPLERTRLQKQINSYNLVLASYDVVRNDIDFFGKIKWNYCILDEGHIIKNSKTKLSKAVRQLQSNHRLILSGTPIQNNVLELWALFDFLMPGFLGSEKQFQATFGKPIVMSRDAKSSTREQEAGALAMESLHKQVLPFLIRRLKEDVLQDLPPKLIQDYYCDLSPLQVKLYEDFSKMHKQKSLEDLSLDDEEIQQENPNKKKKKAFHIFQALQYLRKVCNHPALVLNDQHPEYCQINEKLKKESTNIHELSNVTKFVALRQLLNDCGIGLSDMENSEGPVVNQHRILLFCQMKNMLDLLEKYLFKPFMPNVTYLRLDGSVPAINRFKIVNRFNSDPSIDILLLTTHVGGLGLNLTGADTVVFFDHDWNPMRDLQAMDRAHRIGQKKVVTVFRLITRGTLEEKIMGLQKFKMSIANTVINQENHSISSMGMNQLLDLFCLEDNSKVSVKKSIENTSIVEIDKNLGKIKKTGKSIIENLEELWDSKQYDSEFDLDNYMKTLE